MIGLIAGIDNLGNGLAIAALLFTGPLAAGLGAGVGVVLLSAAILALLVALRSTQPNSVALVQETGVAILASTVATMAAGLEGAPEGVRIATAFAILGGSTLVTGLLFWMVGRLRLGRLVRFFPYPVVAGFLAGSGWLLVEGALAMVSGRHGLGAGIAGLAAPMVAVTAAAAVGLAGLLVLVMRRSASPFAMPLVLLTAALAFHAGLPLLGVTAEQARGWGWLPGVAGGDGFSLPVPTEVLALADWGRVAAALPAMVSVAVLGMLGLLLNVSGIELAQGRDIDADAELRSTGAANLLAGALGGPSGYVGLGMTLLAGRMGARGRGAGLATAAVILGGLFVAGWLVSVTPVFLTAGLILFLGVELLQEWLIEARRRLPRTEWLIVLAVVLAIAGIGFMEGLALGLAVSLAMFVYSYSRLPVIRGRHSGAELRSRVDRSPAASLHLTAAGAAIEAMQVQGYLFFGTAEQIVGPVRDRLERAGVQAGGDAGAQPLRFLIIDFRHIKGMDSAAAGVFRRIRNLIEAAGATLVLSALPDAVEDAFRNCGLDPDRDPVLRRAPDLDHALESCEEALLAEDGGSGGGADAPLLRHLEAMTGPHPRLADAVAALDTLHLEPDEVLIRAGETASDVFIIGRGRVKVQIALPDGRSLRLRTMTAGAVVGEIALLLGQTRGADVVVETTATIHRLTAATLARLEREDPELALVLHRILATTLAQKVTLANRLIEQAAV
ncbi:cyclic nucleotide-binding domain-containing protein [Azospirillum melinis]|uniref:Cyclic nucleotide-binding domain-containing protein n=1 Tax=Azospirillum melinis TaxID=328839 RepID=A0ABX2K451_9PROT|nr:SulP family inorganic anion transporter [Azospirillum melinis]MBP2303971.1 SulP family sulfate permease [Azospirillum melinis]NUA98339.1 cyclic nucleotide-binding domain-containing protein [Azospirillum melinis]